MNIEAMKLALEALDLAKRSHGIMLLSDPPQEAWKTYRVDDAIKESTSALRQAIEQAEQAQKQEPVAKVVSTAPKQIWLDLGFDPSDEDEILFNDLCDATWSHDNATGYGIEYVRADLASPPQRQPLTDEQIEACLHHVDEDGIGLFAFARAIEAAHGIKEKA